MILTDALKEQSVTHTTVLDVRTGTGDIRSIDLAAHPGRHVVEAVDAPNEAACGQP
ncbi:hypothetical protein [Nocardia sp. NBC_01388]|uniref:hypothetical protein n=1 Tax=Nocardia sp. NBC_01388 TaxID=2903596 RepID=UPI003250851B